MIVPDKKRLFYLSLLTLFGMGAIGILLIVYVQKKDVYNGLLGGREYYLQFLSGLIFGGLASALAIMLLQSAWFRSVRMFFGKLVLEIQPTFLNIVFYSFCAGVGEEILFRAGVQPLIGIWPTSLLFVFLHGYINPSNINLSIYGVFLVIICSGFGYLYKFFGLSSCITAHFIYDISMFSLLRYSTTVHPGLSDSHIGQSPAPVNPPKEGYDARPRRDAGDKK